MGTDWVSRPMLLKNTFQSYEKQHIKIKRTVMNKTELGRRDQKWLESHTIRYIILIEERIWYITWWHTALIYWGWVTHRCQAIIWTNTGILLIEPLGINLSGIVMEISIFSFKRMYLKRLSAKFPPFCLGLNVLRHNLQPTPVTPPPHYYNCSNVAKHIAMCLQITHAHMCYLWLYPITSTCVTKAHGCFSLE